MFYLYLIGVAAAAFLLVTVAIWLYDEWQWAKAMELIYGDGQTYIVPYNEGFDVDEDDNWQLQREYDRAKASREAHHRSLGASAELDEAGVWHVYNDDGIEVYTVPPPRPGLRAKVIAQDEATEL